MTSGGLMQLVAYGAQDIYLTGNPQITYFKVVYRRHTNFAMEAIEQTFNGSADFNKRVTCLVSRNGDLINRVYLEAVLPAIQSSYGSGGTGSGSIRWVDDVGHHLIKQVEVEIGGQSIDKHYSDWLEIYAELTVEAGHMLGYRKMIGQYGLFTNDVGVIDEASLQYYGMNARPETRIYVPLRFWFCRNVGLSLPLIALQYHEVKINLTFAPFTDLVISAYNNTAKTTSSSLVEASLWVDYIYLDTDERRRFAQVSHEYLIEQLQFTGDETVTASGDTATKSYTMNFNHPCKEIVWVLQHTKMTSDSTRRNQWSNYTSRMAEEDECCRRPFASANPVKDAKIQLNGHDRFDARFGTYFNWVQPYQHHTNIPDSPGINVYSFALKPEEHQPSGTCNFSRIDNAVLVLNIDYSPDYVDSNKYTNTTFNTDNGNETSAALEAGTLSTVSAALRVFAVNYNVLRIMSGMGGLAYSN